MAPMNEAALKSMTKMIQVMLPYETNYEPRETSTQALREIVDVLRENNPQVNEFLGFINYLFKQMDASEDTGKFDRALMRVWAIINEHYPSSELDYPEDLGENEVPEHVTLESRDDKTSITFHGVHSTEP